MSDSSVATNGGVAPAAAATAGEGAPAGGDAGDQPPPSWGEMLKGIMWRFLIMYFIMNLFKGNKTPPADGGGGGSVSQGGGQVATTNTIQARNLFARGTVMDMYLYISEYERMKWREDKGERNSVTGTNMYRLNENTTRGVWRSDPNL